MIILELVGQVMGPSSMLPLPTPTPDLEGGCIHLLAEGVWMGPSA